MLFPEKMLEVHVLTTEDYLKDLSTGLMKFGEFELKNVRLKDAEKLKALEKASDQEKQAERVGNIKLRLDRLASSVGVPENLLKDTLDKRKPMSLDELDSRLRKIENEFYSLSEKIESLEKEELDLRFRKVRYNIRNQIESVTKELKGEKLFIVVVAIPKYEIQAVQKVLSNVPSLVQEVEEIGNVAVFLLVTPENYKQEVLKLSASFVKQIGLEEILKEEVNIEEIEAKLREVESEKKRTKAILDKLREGIIDEILELYEGLWFNSVSLKIKNASLKAKKFFLFSGWIPQRLKKEFEEVVKNATRGVYVIEFKEAEKVLKEDKNSVVPTKLNNPKFLFSFESLVKLYSIPRFFEIDPTIILTVLYVIFYGMMFGDVGQGLVLFLVSLILFLKFKNFRVIAGLGMAVGLSAVFFGVMYGSVFGIEEKIIPHVWISPLHDVIEIMKVSILIGAFVITLGLILNIINTIRAKNFVELIFGHHGLAGLIFYSSLVIYPIYVFLTNSKFDFSIMLWGILIAIVMFVIEAVIEAKHHHQKVSPISVFFNIFEVFISFISNTVSFIRIAGFALNHTALVITFSSIAQVLKGSTIGDILALIVIVFGHLFIIGFEGFIVGIQALRLSYYEFFTKFFKGGGKAFEPIK